MKSINKLFRENYHFSKISIISYIESVIFYQKDKKFHGRKALSFITSIPPIDLYSSA